ncbi:uncharacterized protein LAESUDRAFT_283276 [Laetiporus sulphureus 93-53]|uniref:Uncharacterized protein n=1 Tax=Laetiporus sulphureus 93-53 TaxID=1314785 RepID=A0A165DFD6_9APHY|nr:uncharacterized protein LAESUDRAFT_283276 [Laetiporus sulphureus 93-53]KZT04774.1 hypothetical protein LAESUDRAFT_283276 [Laetiporus sulphureus 93-53]
MMRLPMSLYRNSGRTNLFLRRAQRPRVRGHTLYRQEPLFEPFFSIVFPLARGWTTDIVIKSGSRMFSALIASAFCRDSKRGDSPPTLAHGDIGCWSELHHALVTSAHWAMKLLLRERDPRMHASQRCFRARDEMRSEIDLFFVTFAKDGLPWHGNRHKPQHRPSSNAFIVTDTALSQREQRLGIFHVSFFAIASVAMPAENVDKGALCFRAAPDGSGKP